MTTTPRVNFEKKTQVKFIELSGTKESTFLNCKMRGRKNICLATKHLYCRLLSKHSKTAQQPVLFEMNFEKKTAKKIIETHNTSRYDSREKYGMGHPSFPTDFQDCAF